MAARQRFAILGLGSFGRSLCFALAETATDVIAVDRHRDNVSAVSDVVDRAIEGDATDPAVLEAAGIGDCDVAIVAIGENTESSVIATLNLQDLGVPSIYARAMTSTHRRLLRKLGIARVINPEEESAVRLAASLSRDGIEQLVELGEGHSFVIVHAPERFAGKSLLELDLRRNYGVNVVGIRRVAEGSSDGRVDFSYTRFIQADPDTRIEEMDRLLLVGRPERIAAMRSGGEG